MDELLNEEQVEQEVQEAAEAVEVPEEPEIPETAEEPEVPEPQGIPEERFPALEEKKRNRKPAHKKKKRRASRLRVPAFLLHLGEDVRWYYDVRLWSPLILLLLILALVLPGRKKAAPVEEKPQTPVVIVEETVPETTAPEPVSVEADALARLAESVGAGRSNNVKTIIMWVAVNRSEDRANGYGMDLVGEIARPNQWQGYDAAIHYSEETLALAKSVLDIRDNDGLRPLDNDMLWFVLNDNGSITVRNKFVSNGNQKWNEKTIK